MLLKREFSNSSLRTGMDPDTWLVEVDAMRKCLERNFGSPMTDEDFIIHIVENLPQKA